MEKTFARLKEGLFKKLFSPRKEAFAFDPEWLGAVYYDGRSVSGVGRRTIRACAERTYGRNQT